VSLIGVVVDSIAPVPSLLLSRIFNKRARKDAAAPMGDDPEEESNPDWSDSLEAEARFELICCSDLETAAVFPITDVSLKEEEVVDVNEEENKFSERLYPGFEDEKEGLVGVPWLLLIGLSLSRSTLRRSRAGSSSWKTEGAVRSKFL